MFYVLVNNAVEFESECETKTTGILDQVHQAADACYEVYGEEMPHIEMIELKDDGLVITDEGLAMVMDILIDENGKVSKIYYDQFALEDSLPF